MGRLDSEERVLTNITNSLGTEVAAGFMTNKKEKEKPLQEDILYKNLLQSPREGFIDLEVGDNA